MADVGEPLLAVFATGLDEQVARSEQALDEALAEVHVVDTLERDLDSAACEQALSVDETLRGDDEVDGAPAEVTAEQPGSGPHEQSDVDPLQHQNCRWLGRRGSNQMREGCL